MDVMTGIVCAHTGVVARVLHGPPLYLNVFNRVTGRRPSSWSSGAGPGREDPAGPPGLDRAGRPQGVELLRLLAVPPAVHLAGEPLDVGRETLHVLDVFSAEEGQAGAEVDVVLHAVRLERVHQEAAQLPAATVPVREDDRPTVPPGERLREVEHRDTGVQWEHLPLEAELTEGPHVLLPFHEDGDFEVRLGEFVDHRDEVLVRLLLVHGSSPPRTLGVDRTFFQRQTNT